jgi:hypothetical protein
LWFERAGSSFQALGSSFQAPGSSFQALGSGLWALAELRVQALFRGLGTKASALIGMAKFENFKIESLIVVARALKPELDLDSLEPRA